MSAFSREKVIEHSVDILQREGWQYIEVDDRGRTIFVAVGAEGSSDQYIEEPMGKLLRAAYALGGPELYSEAEEYDIEPFPAESRVGQLVDGCTEALVFEAELLGLLETERMKYAQEVGWGSDGLNIRPHIIEVRQNPDLIQAAYPAHKEKSEMIAEEAAGSEVLAGIAEEAGAPTTGSEEVLEEREMPLTLPSPVPTVQAEGSPKSSYQFLNTLIAQHKLIRRGDGSYIAYRKGHKIELVSTEFGVLFAVASVKAKGYFSKLWKARLVEAIL